jgi:soluble lytic murein transglycosylase
MSTRSAPRRPAHARSGRRASARARRATRRRRLAAILGVAALTAFVAVLVGPSVPDAVRDLTLPLHHEDVIRQQAEAKDLDPSLVAAVIYTESRFRDQTSHAGARGLMQITPDTAAYIARLSGGTSFEQGDLATPEINIAYGTYYLRYLLRRYGGNEVLALAAYNGGEGNVDRWIAEKRGGEDGFTSGEIPFAETRAYVDRVLDVRESYRSKYGDELGMS